MTTALEGDVTAHPTSVAARIVDGAKVYGAGETEVRALDGISAEFRTGQFTAIMGPSGSGKSTLLHCLAGLDRLTTGTVLLGDVELGTLSDKSMTILRREHIGFIFQSFNLVPTLTAGENIALPLTLGGKKPDPTWLEGLTTSLGIADRLKHRPSELSGGQQQRVATARALVTRPDLLFADEPTGNLDTHTGEEISELLFALHTRAKTTLFLVTHEERLAQQCSRIVRLKDGLIVADERK
jgi:putative ABC transport system ATP-binding protein